MVLCHDTIKPPFFRNGKNRLKKMLFFCIFWHLLCLFHGNYVAVIIIKMSSPAKLLTHLLYFFLIFCGSAVLRMFPSLQSACSLYRFIRMSPENITVSFLLISYLCLLKPDSMQPTVPCPAHAWFDIPARFLSQPVAAMTKTRVEFGKSPLDQPL